MAKPKRDAFDAWDDPLERARSRLGAAARIVGVDEAGRGPLAGPVVAAAAWLAEDCPLIAMVADSKTLSAPRRETLFAALRLEVAAGRADLGIGAASVAEIDALNILHANDLAMARAVARLTVEPALALIDGSWRPRTLRCPAEPVVKGDARVPAIAAASIVAKVVRDRAMAKLDRRHPIYGWAKNAGYPTKAHRAAIDEHGLCPHHRRSFGRAAR
ncbi:MAG: ribonuclease HII [Pseudomonadota bacterium]